MTLEHLSVSKAIYVDGLAALCRSSFARYERNTTGSPPTYLGWRCEHWTQYQGCVMYPFNFDKLNLGEATYPMLTWFKVLHSIIHSTVESAL
jgi:hypothetical protein